MPKANFHQRPKDSVAQLAMATGHAMRRLKTF